MITQDMPNLEALKLFDVITSMDCDAANMQEQNRRKSGFKYKIHTDNAQNFGSLT